MYDFSSLTTTFNLYLTLHLGATSATLVEMAIVGILAISLFAFLGLFLVYMERKVAAFMQLRLGPNRVGYKGTLQTLADTIKLLFKEGFAPQASDKFLFNFAPILVIVVAMLLLAPIPFAKGLQIYDINIGVFYVSA